MDAKAFAIRNAEGTKKVVHMLRDYNPAQHLIETISDRPVRSMQRKSTYFSWPSQVFVAVYHVEFEDVK